MTVMMRAIGWICHVGSQKNNRLKKKLKCCSFRFSPGVFRVVFFRADKAVLHKAQKKPSVHWFIAGGMNDAPVTQHCLYVLLLDFAEVA